MVKNKEFNLFQLFPRIDKLARAKMERIIKGSDFHDFKIHCINVIEALYLAESDSLTLTQIAQYCEVSQQAIGRKKFDLQKSKYISCEILQTDRRSQEIKLTDKGKRLAAFLFDQEPLLTSQLYNLDEANSNYLRTELQLLLEKLEIHDS